MKKKLVFFLFLFILLATSVFGYCNETQTVTGNVTEVVRQCTVTTDLGGTPLLGVILAPMFLAFIILFGGMHLDSEKHGVLKIFIFLFGIIPYWASMHFGTVVLARYYDLIELQNAMADSVFWVGMIFFTLVSYFMIYTLIAIFKRIAENKEQKLEY